MIFGAPALACKIHWRIRPTDEAECAIRAFCTTRTQPNIL
jgi:hypothetical protein